MLARQASKRISLVAKKSTKTVSGLIILFLVISLITCLLYFQFHPESFAIGNNEKPVMKDGKKVLDKDGNEIMEPITSNLTNGFYYWATLTSTAGFGDICPKTTTAKMLTSFYQLILTVVSMGGIWILTDDKMRKARDKLAHAVMDKKR